MPPDNTKGFSSLLVQSSCSKYDGHISNLGPGLGRPRGSYRQDIPAVLALIFALPNRYPVGFTDGCVIFARNFVNVIKI